MSTEWRANLKKPAPLFFCIVTCFSSFFPGTNWQAAIVPSVSTLWDYFDLVPSICLKWIMICNHFLSGESINLPRPHSPLKDSLCSFPFVQGYSFTALNSRTHGTFCSETPGCCSLLIFHGSCTRKGWLSITCWHSVGCWPKSCHFKSSHSSHSCWPAIRSLCMGLVIDEFNMECFPPLLLLTGN